MVAGILALTVTTRKGEKVMNKLLLTIIILLFTEISFSQSLEMPNIEVEPIYKGEYRIVVSETGSVPPHEITEVAGYDYQIKMKISFNKNIQNIDSNYGIVCKLPGNEIKKLLFNVDSLIEISPRNYEYSFSIRIKEKGWVNIFVAEKEDFSKDLDIAIYKNKSNLESYYLDAW